MGLQTIVEGAHLGSTPAAAVAPPPASAPPPYLHLGHASMPPAVGQHAPRPAYLAAYSMASSHATGEIDMPGGGPFTSQHHGFLHSASGPEHQDSMTSESGGGGPGNRPAPHSGSLGWGGASGVQGSPGSASGHAFGAHKIKGAWKTLAGTKAPTPKLGSMARSQQAHHALETRSGANRLRRASRAQPLTHMDDLTWADGQMEVILITGNSCFDHLDDLLAALSFGVMGTVPPTTQPTSSQPLALTSPTPMSDPAFGSQPDGGAEGDGFSNGNQPVTSPFAVVGQMSRRASLARSRVVVIDTDGPSEMQASQVECHLGIIHLHASPLQLGDLRHLHLPNGCTVRALVLPNLATLEESSALGAGACQTDAEAIRVCSNLRQYCEYVGANLEVWTEAVLPVTVPYLVPLCLDDGPYFGGAAETEAMSRRNANAWNHHATPAGGHGRRGKLVAKLTHRHVHKSQSFARREEEALHVIKAQRTALEAGISFNWKDDCAACCTPPIKSVQHMLSDPSQEQVAEAYIGRALSANPGLSPSLAPGMIFMSGIIDKLFCQVLFNPLLVQILMKAMGVWENDHEAERPYSSTQDTLPSEQVTCQTTATVEELRAPGGARMSQSDFGGDGPRLSGNGSQHQPSCIHLFPLTQIVASLRRRDFPTLNWQRAMQQQQEQQGQRRSKAGGEEGAMMEIGATWECLFIECTSNSLLPIGLYRRDPESGFPYVYTAPDPDTPLRATDEVYILAAPGNLPPELLV